jgi:hypothetical protein
MKQWLRQNWLSLLVSSVAVIGFFHLTAFQKLIDADWKKRRPFFTIDSLKATSDEPLPFDSTLKQLELTCRFRNRGTLPADSFLFIPFINGEQAPVYSSPKTIKPGNGVKVSFKHVRAARTPESPFVIKALLRYNYASEHFVQEFSYLYHPDKKTVKPIKNLQNFSVEETRVISDGPNPGDNSIRVLKIRYVFLNIGGSSAEEISFIPFFEGRQLSNIESNLNMLMPGQTFNALGTYHWPSSSSKTSLKLKIQLKYKSDNEVRVDEFDFLYHPDKKTIELLKDKKGGHHKGRGRLG